MEKDNVKKETVVRNVRKLMILFPETRTNDKLLLSYYWRLIDKLDFSNMESFMHDYIEKATIPETISRARRFAQKEPPFEPKSNEKLDHFISYRA
ncbi:hypothetical protein AYJ08_00450 [Brevibacillus sp. SKDU10]|nr:hypothetical protein AYJ08_00450 [Brevibacillus sp. SKDU10]